MRSVLRKASWALAAAGGMSLTAPAFSQEPMRILPPGGHVVSANEPGLLSEAQLHQDEAKVELAFLAEPMLFSFELGAHVAAEGLEVHGYVPNEVVRDRALRVAREHTMLPVVDKLKTQANVTAHSSVDRPETIQRAAQALLAESFPEYGAKIDVKCDAHGHVTLSGRIGSDEDKLAVSRKLRQVSGCSCVVNQLSAATAAVVTEPHPSQPVSELVFPDTPRIVPAKPAGRKVPLPPTPLPTRTIVTPIIPDSEPSNFGMPRVYPTPPPNPPSVPAPAIDVPAPTIKPEPHKSEPVHSIDPDRSYGGGSTSTMVPVVPLPTKLEPPKSVPLPSIDQDRPYSSRRNETTLPDVPPPVKPEPPKPASVPSIDKDRPYSGRSTEVTLPDLPPVKAEPRRPSVPNSDKDRPYGGPIEPDLPRVPPVKAPAPPVDLPDLTPARTTLPPQSRVSPPVMEPKIITVSATVPQIINGSNPTPKPIDLDRPPRGGSEESYVTEGTITFADDPPPPAKPAWSGTKPAPIPVKPVEGTIKLTPPPLPPSRPASAPVVLPVPPVRTTAAVQAPAARLKERVQAICGSAYQVKVTILDKRHWLLDVTGDHNYDENKRMLERLKPVCFSAEFSGIEIDARVE